MTWYKKNWHSHLVTVNSGKLMGHKQWSFSYEKQLLLIASYIVNVEKIYELHRARIVTAHRMPATLDDLKRSFWDLTSCQGHLLTLVGHDIYLVIHLDPTNTLPLILCICLNLIKGYRRKSAGLRWPEMTSWGVSDNMAPWSSRMASVLWCCLN